MSDQAALAGAVVLDSSAELSDRVAALHQLSSLNTEKAIQVAISVTENPDEPPVALVAIGKEIARIASNGRWLTEFEVRNMSELAFETYCEYLK
ncbi:MULTISPECIES: hypothetical protein [unclassified Streptomyces]|uniref:hypothetical protein n=1 Tax=unclassified Streptomyces TaxID=2593676 RepID=UPI0029A2F707|nr:MULTISPECIES: hypothetical protein [unclassified Streptomyces]MDX3772257.1 hypothetical protein [Streptomyces sp. AK08-01B]MDX3821789.1 hypothetical protein [Streptomyces sp. AK08-01A]